jgi:hypothetical protein
MCGDNGFSFSVFDLEGSAWEWPKYRYDQYNTGCYQSGNWHGIRSGFTRPADQARALNASPNPFRDRLMIFYNTGAVQSATESNPGKSIKLQIYDVTGRLVKSFPLGSTPYARSFVWDGTDTRGLSIPAGVYFLTLKTPAGCDIRKIIRVK